MYKPDFWTQSAEAMELTNEGNGLIAQAIAQLARDLWQRLDHSLVAVQGVEPRHLPPI